MFENYGWTVFIGGTIIGLCIIGISIAGSYVFTRFMLDREERLNDSSED